MRLTCILVAWIAGIAQIGRSESALSARFSSFFDRDVVCTVDAMAITALLFKCTDIIFK